MAARRTLLLINPNTSEAVGALLQAHAARVAGDGVRVVLRNARFGAPYIACEASYAVAGHAVLDAWACARAAAHGSADARFDAVLIACFGDPGLFALRECSAHPVTGLAEGSFAQAAQTGRFAIVTGGARWRPMLERLADNLGCGAQLAGVHTVAQSGAELARDPVAAHAILRAACAHAAQEFGAASVILGGAGLAGMAQPIAQSLGLPVIDSVTAGVQHALTRARDADAPARDRDFEFPWLGVSPELAALGASAR